MKHYFVVLTLLSVLLFQAVCAKAVLAENIIYDFTADFSSLLISDTEHTLTGPQRWDSQDWRDLTMYTAGIGAVFILDKPLYDAIHRQRSDSLNSFASFVQQFGDYPSFGIIGAFYAGGVLSDDSRAKSTAVDALASSFVGAGIITTSLKVVTGRSRPNAGDGTYSFQPFGGDHSFPSGHTTQAFAIASVIGEHYDEPWIDITSYGIATLVGLARIEQEKHFPSDVVAGAVIGTVVGKTITRYNKAHPNRFSLIPATDGQTTGVMVRVEY